MDSLELKKFQVLELFNQRWEGGEAREQEKTNGLLQSVFDFDLFFGAED